jgi:hypothetical protein
VGSEPLEASLSEHEAVAPPLLLAQVHDHGPLPLTFEAVPALQRFAVGAVLTDAPFALPQAPFGSNRAEQLAVVPPPEPAQVQFHGPEPLTLEALPALQRFAAGALVRSAPFAGPHWPFTESSSATQIAVLPPLLPTQAQVQGPLPATVVAVPTPQRLAVGAVTATPAAPPHDPFT